MREPNMDKAEREEDVKMSEVAEAVSAITEGE